MSVLGLWAMRQGAAEPKTEEPVRVFADGRAVLHAGDCFATLRTLGDNSLDAIVTDPPYALVSIGKRFGADGAAQAIAGATGVYARASAGFMGKKWDTGETAFSVLFWAECMRVLKPGGYVAAFSGTRTYHRLACAIEDAGFDIRDQLAWVYGCLDEKTMVASEKGVAPHTSLKIGDLVLCYDADGKEYSYHPVLDIVEYEYDDVAFRVVGAAGEQVVSRNHRCIVEREGVEGFQLAETLQHQVRVPFLESLSDLQEAVCHAQQVASVKEQNVQQNMREREYSTRAEGYFTAFGDSQRADSCMCSLRETCLEAKRLAEEIENEHVFTGMQRDCTRRRVEKTCLQRPCSLDGGKQGAGSRAFYGSEKSCVEGRSYGESVAWESSRSDLCSLSSGILEHGTQGRLCDAAQAYDCAGDRALIAAKRGCASHKSSVSGQSLGEFHAVSDERRAQGVRAWSGHKTDLVRVVPFHYVGKVWCLRVSTGAFVAVRGGVAFPTGNSGFPKSLDISKAIDKAAGATREVVGSKLGLPGYSLATSNGSNLFGGKFGGSGDPRLECAITAPSTDAARQWAGFGTALKPAWEPIVLARKPLIGTNVENVLAWGTGALNIGGCRVGTDPITIKGGGGGVGTGWGLKSEINADRIGRFPANIITDGSDEVLAAFPGFGEAARFFASFSQCAKADKCSTQSHASDAELSLALSSELAASVLKDAVARSTPQLVRICTDFRAPFTNVTPNELRQISEIVTETIQCFDTRCSRGLQPQSFMLKSDHAECAVTREPTGIMRITTNLLRSNGSAEPVTFNITETNEALGVPGFESKRFHYGAKANKTDRAGSKHPTVKPISLIRWICRLITPPGGTVLDPFAGSGTTGVAALEEGFNVILCERETEYLEDITRRLKDA